MKDERIKEAVNVEERTDIVEQVSYAEENNVAATDEITSESAVLLGKVVDCTKLNVRTRPYPDADVCGIVAVGTELMIEREESTTDFYKVCTEAGLEGFCMKKFVAVQP